MDIAPFKEKCLNQEKAGEEGRSRTKEWEMMHSGKRKGNVSKELYCGATKDGTDIILSYLDSTASAQLFRNKDFVHDFNRSYKKADYISKQKLLRF